MADGSGPNQTQIPRSLADLIRRPIVLGLYQPTIRRPTETFTVAFPQVLLPGMVKPVALLEGPGNPARLLCFVEEAQPGTARNLLAVLKEVPAYAAAKGLDVLQGPLKTLVLDRLDEFVSEAWWQAIGERPIKNLPWQPAVTIAPTPEIQYPDFAHAV